MSVSRASPRSSAAQTSQYSADSLQHTREAPNPALRDSRTIPAHLLALVGFTTMTCSLFTAYLRRLANCIPSAGDDGTDLGHRTSGPGTCGMLAFRVHARGDIASRTCGRTCGRKSESSQGWAHERAWGEEQRGGNYIVGGPEGMFECVLVDVEQALCNEVKKEVQEEGEEIRGEACGCWTAGARICPG
jgi:hypothetical protein